MTRRGLLKAGVSVVAVSAIASPQEAKAFIVAALAIAAAVASLVSAFTKRGDGGLGALLTSIRDLELVMIDQLKSIQIGLVRIEQEIAALPKQVEGLLDQALAAQLSATLSGSLEEFRTVVTVRSSKRRFTPSERQANESQIRELRDRIVAARQTLQASKAGSGSPHAALIAAYILPIEVATRYFASEPRESIVSALEGYRDWQGTLLDVKSGTSIPSFINQWADAATDRLREAGEVPLVGATFIKNFPGDVRTCFEYQEYTPPTHATYYQHCSLHGEVCSDRKVGDDRSEVFGASSRVYATMHMTEESLDGANLMDILDRTDDYQDWSQAKAHLTASYIPNRSKFPGLSDFPRINLQETHGKEPYPMSTEDALMVCKLTRARPASGTDRIAQIYGDEAFGLADYDRRLEELKEKVAALNEARLYLAFGVNSQVVAYGLGDIIAQAERVYGS